MGSGLIMALQFGCARGLFSNESGLGTAPIVAAAAKTKNPADQALISMTGAVLVHRASSACSRGSCSCPP